MVQERLELPLRAPFSDCPVHPSAVVNSHDIVQEMVIELMQQGVDEKVSSLCRN